MNFMIREHLIYFEVWHNVILSIYCNPDANVVALKGIAHELNQMYANKFNDAIDK